MRKSFAIFFFATLLLLTACILIGLTDLRTRNIGGHKEGQAVFSYKNTPLAKQAEITLLGERYVIDYSAVKYVEKIINQTAKATEPYLLPHKAIAKALKEKLNPPLNLIESKLTKRIPDFFES